MLPPAGYTRCYWALLSPSLQFLYLDPVFQSHLANPDASPSTSAKAAADVLVGKSLLDFVHPDEQGSAKTDLGNVLDSKTLHGSVTRVRFARLNKIRAELGFPPSPDTWAGADKVGVDVDYMAVDVVINWAAEGLVLCFMHAIVDIDAESENDPNKHGPWSNWCGTPELAPAQVQMMFSRLVVCGGEGAGSGARVFQILANDESKTHLITWPPVDHRPLARLAHDINVDTVNTDAKTSCTRRFKAGNMIPEVGHVESVFIPHGILPSYSVYYFLTNTPCAGSIIFACHKVEPPNLMSPSSYDYYIPPNPHSYSYQPPWNRANGSYYDHPPPPAPGPYSGYETQYNLPPPEDEVPPPRRRASPTQQQQTPSPTSQSAQGSGGRGNRPAGILKCTSCKATTSPEWRKGPSGRKELCNACGLRYARSRAKKEGGGAKSGRGGANGGKVRSSTSVAAMRREGSATSSTGGKTDGGPSEGVFDSTAYQGPAPTYDYYRGREEEPARFTDSPSQPPRPDDRFKAPPYDRPPYAADSRAYPSEGERFYHPSPLASYERRRE